MGSKCSKGSDLPTTDPAFLKKADVPLDEFEVLPENKIAEYDPEELSKHWNTEKENASKSQNLFKALFTNWKKGVWATSIRVICVYIISYYIVNYLVIQWWCARDYPTQYREQTPYQEMMLKAMTNQGNTQVLANLSAASGNLTRRQQLAEKFKRHGCTNYEATFATFAAQEAAFTRLLTFLLGFYVSFTINRWWKQITSVPTVDGLCVALGAFIWVDPSKTEDEIYVKEGVTVKQFKHTIARYFLLSWTMVMSTVGKPLEDKLKHPLDFNKKGLITYEEYVSLKTKHGGDTWKGKWSLPLLWAGSMICEAAQATKDNDHVKIKELKEIMNAVNRFQASLSDVLHYEANRSPDLIDQTIRLAVWFWVAMGIFSSQGMVNKEFNIGIVGALFMNFPLLHIIKYFLIISWLKTAAYLENPFGNDE